MGEAERIRADDTDEDAGIINRLSDSSMADGVLQGVPEDDVDCLMIWPFDYSGVQGDSPPCSPQNSWGVLLAHYEHLPIYKAAFDLLVHFEKTVANFSRYNKYTHGKALRDITRDTVMLIVRLQCPKQTTGAGRNEDQARRIESGDTNLQGDSSFASPCSTREQ